MNQCANQKWNEVFVLNELSFESLNDEIPITIVKNVLKYPEKVREFFDNGYWWTNGYDDDCSRPGKSFEFGMNTESYCEPLVNQLIQFYDAEDILPIEIYANCFNGNMDLYNERSVLPHVDTFPEDDQNYDPLNDIAIITSKSEKDQGRHCQIAPHRVSKAFIHVFGDVTRFLECAELLLIGSLVAFNLQFLHRGLQLDIVLTLLKNKVGQPPLGRTSCDEQD